jgi:hypothetical protein
VGILKINLTRIGGQVRDWIILAHDRDKQGSLVNVLINPLVPQNVKNSITNRKTVDVLCKQSALLGVNYMIRVYINSKRFGFVF